MKYASVATIVLGVAIQNASSVLSSRVQVLVGVANNKRGAGNKGDSPEHMLRHG